MQDFADSKLPADKRRRASDLLPGSAPPSGEPLLQLLREMLTRLDAIEGALTGYKRAFVLNDLDEPDIDGHRRAHNELIAASKVVQGYKADATKAFIGWATIGAISIFIAGVLMWIKDHLK